ncbi:MAG: hypothetical protein JRJ78_04270 [Deltaproteobacteria bacterium]|nr:hypothetical protein [Deltaproteobacteria bacterium]
MVIEIPLETLVYLYRLAALGKLMNGLIHNLNGPLQNIGIDMEMMTYKLRQKRAPEDSLTEDFSTRLKRMEGEFDAVNHLVRTASAKGGRDEVLHESRSLRGFFEETLSFLRANLYFKHNVRKEIRLKNNASTDGLSPEVLLALEWLLQGLAEELERGKGSGLIIEGEQQDKEIVLDFIIEGVSPSSRLKEALEIGGAPGGNLRIEAEDLGLNLVSLLLKRFGCTLECLENESGGKIRAILPFPQKTSP